MIPRRKMTLRELEEDVRRRMLVYGSAGVRVDHSDTEVWATVFVGDPEVNGELLELYEADIIADVWRLVKERRGGTCEA